MKRAIAFLLVLVAGCQCLDTEEVFTRFGRFLTPNEIVVGYSWGGLDGEADRDPAFQQNAWSAALVFQVYPAPVRVVNTWQAPRAWYEPQVRAEPEPDPEPDPEPEAEITVETDAEGNTVFTIPNGVIATFTALALAYVTAQIRRRMSGATTPDTE